MVSPSTIQERGEGRGVLTCEVLVPGRLALPCPAHLPGLASSAGPCARSERRHRPLAGHIPEELPSASTWPYSGPWHSQLLEGSRQLPADSQRSRSSGSHTHQPWHSNCREKCKDRRKTNWEQPRHSLELGRHTAELVAGNKHSDRCIAGRQGKLRKEIVVGWSSRGSVEKPRTCLVVKSTEIQSSPGKTVLGSAGNYEWHSRS